MLQRSITIYQPHRSPSMSSASLAQQPPQCSSRSTLRGGSRHFQKNHYYRRRVRLSPSHSRMKLQVVDEYNFIHTQTFTAGY
ncbi:hypothetical protein LINPERPRIM_LOCUS9946 [Linum perenne]